MQKSLAILLIVSTLMCLVAAYPQTMEPCPPPNGPPPSGAPPSGPPPNGPPPTGADGPCRGPGGPGGLPPPTKAATTG